jgi:hypothetical protein
MKTIRVKGGNNNIITYERENDTATAYHKETPTAIREILEDALESRDRLRLFFGDTKTGRDWNEEHDVIGYIGRSTGKVKIPLLINNARSSGGGAILDHRIVKIMEGNRVRYQHPKYKIGDFSALPSKTKGYYTDVFIDGVLVARFKKPGQAGRWIAFMKGERNGR